MKIAFWRNVERDVGVTTNTACLAAMHAIHGGKSLMVENHYGLHNIGSIIMPQERVDHLREEGHYHYKYGIEHILKELYAGSNDKDLLYQAAIPIVYENLLYLPQSYIVNREVFNYEFDLVREKLFQYLEEISDDLFIDTETNRNHSSVHILSETDLVVVNLIQDEKALGDFFENYSSICDKALFIISKYQKENPWNMRKISYQYQIPPSRLGVIPYNMELEDAMKQGRLLQFLNRNMEGTLTKENQYFMRHLQKTVAMLERHTQP